MPETGVITRPQLVLASASPNRLRLLEHVGVHPVVRPSNIDESAAQGETPDVLVERLAVGKANAVAEGKHLFVGADTLVVADGKALGKPAGPEEARDMLERLSGREHRVVSGVAVMCNGATQSSVTSTSVQFRELAADEIAWYVELAEWQGKAGAYAIQGAGGLLIGGVRGDYHNVVGLPLTELDRLLGVFGRPLRTWMT